MRSKPKGRRGWTPLRHGAWRFWDGTVIVYHPGRTYWSIRWPLGIRQGLGHCGRRDTMRFVEEGHPSCPYFMPLGPLGIRKRISEEDAAERIQQHRKSLWAYNTRGMGPALEHALFYGNTDARPATFTGICI